MVARRCWLRVLCLTDPSYEGRGAFELGDGRITDTGVSCRFASSTQTIKDPDIWIASTYRVQRAVIFDPLESKGANGQVRGIPEEPTVHGNPAVYLPFTNPRDIPPSLQFSSALSWFDQDGVFWSVQGRNLDLNTLRKIADSLQELTVGSQ